jgi:hypothetical protein
VKKTLFFILFVCIYNSSFNQNLCNYNDPEIINQWGLYNTNDIDINGCEAWQNSTGQNIKVGIIGNGFELSLSDLQPNIVQSFDGDNNSSPSQNYTNYKAFGTPNAGIVAAVRDNNICIAGVAPNAKLMSYSAHTDSGFRNCFLNGISNGADVFLFVPMAVSIPNLGNLCMNGFVESRINGRNGLGALSVIPTGDIPGSLNFIPNQCRLNGDFYSSIYVGGIDNCGYRTNAYSSCQNPSYSSMYCSLIDLVAPGVNIYSTYDGNIFQPNCTNLYTGSYYAASFVAGVAALVLELLPCSTAEEVRKILCKTAKKLPNYSFITDPDHPEGTWNNEVGYGLVDAYAATKEAKRVKNAETNTIQNAIITSNQEFFSKSTIRIGENVNPNIAQLPVTFDSTSKSVIKASQSIKIENGTSIKAGAKFHAYIELFTNQGCYNYAPPPMNKKIMNQINYIHEPNNEKIIEQNNSNTNFTNNISIFPNPSDNKIKININIDKPSILKIKISNIIGQVLYEEQKMISKGISNEDIANTFSDYILITKVSLNEREFTFKLFNSK